MCQIYAGQDPHLYVSTTRSLRLNGQSTSIRLENVFWSVLERMAREEGATLPGFIATLHEEVWASRGAPMNFTSILRSACILFLESGRAGRTSGASAAA